MARAIQFQWSLHEPYTLLIFEYYETPEEACSVVKLSPKEIKSLKHFLGVDE